MTFVRPVPGDIGRAPASPLRFVYAHRNLLVEYVQDMLGPQI